MTESATKSRLYVVGKPDGTTVVVNAISDTQARSHAAALDKYSARVAKPADTLGVKPEDVLDATKVAK